MNKSSYRAAVITLKPKITIQIITVYYNFNSGLIIENKNWAIMQRHCKHTGNMT